MSDEKLQLIRQLAVQARNTDTGDETVNFALNAIMDGFDTLLDEIARLRAENDRLRAGRLRPETVEAIRVVCRRERDLRMGRGTRHAGVKITDITGALVELNRCYPEEV